MTRSDSSRFSTQNDLEHASLLAIETWLQPWRVTKVDQRDDIGRDAIVQIVNRDCRGALSLAGPCAWLQCKGHSAKFEQVFSERLETRHLGLWTLRGAAPAVVVVWSQPSNEIRWRTAQEILGELESAKPNWESQSTVTVQFRAEHSASATGRDLQGLERRIVAESDLSGGRTSIRLGRRRAILPYLYRSTIPSVEKYTVPTPKGEIQITAGPAWANNELDPRDAHAERVLLCSLMLFEETWIPLESSMGIAALLGWSLFLDRVRSGALVPYIMNESVGFTKMEGNPIGGIGTFRLESKDGSNVALGNFMARVPKNDANSFERAVRIPRVTGVSILQETAQDLSRTSIRRLLGLRPYWEEHLEPVWDAPLVARLLEVNRARAIAEWVGADVTILEGGMSRIATEKDYSLFRLDRYFPSSGVFDQVLREFGAPDVGGIVSKLPLSQCAKIAASDISQEFRDWFWNFVAPIVGAGGHVFAEMEQRLRQLVGDNDLSLNVPRELCLRLSEGFDKTCYLGSREIGSTFPGFMTRNPNGERQLAVQRAIHRTRRHAAILTWLQRPPSPADRCPCGSPGSYAECCGVAPSNL